MKICRPLTRIYVHDIETAICFYEKVFGASCCLRFSYPETGLELAQVGNFLIISGSEKILVPFRNTKVTLWVDSIQDWQAHFCWKMAPSSSGESSRSQPVIPCRQKIRTGHGWNMSRMQKSSIIFEGGIHPKSNFFTQRLLQNSSQFFSFAKWNRSFQTGFHPFAGTRIRCCGRFLRIRASAKERKYEYL